VPVMCRYIHVVWQGTNVHCAPYRPRGAARPQHVDMHEPALDCGRGKKKSPDMAGLFCTSTTGGASRSRTGLNGFAGRCISNLIKHLDLINTP